MTQKDPDTVLKETVEKTIDVVADYVETDPRNAEDTVQKVIETVDNNEVKAAIEASDKRAEDTRRAMNSQHPERDNSQKDKGDGGRSEQRSSGAKPDQHKRELGG